MPLVSIIIPIYQVEEYIERCAESLFQQTLQDIEFIFVDDCTPDDSIKKLNKVILKYPHRNIKVLHQPINKGVSWARELGISTAKGKYLGFCDSDDWVETDMYYTLVNTAEKESADIVGCGFIQHTNHTAIEYKFPIKNDTQNFVISPRYFGGIFGALWNKLIRRDFYLKYNKDLWKGITMWEDSCLLIPLRLHSRCTIFINKYLYHYNINTNSITTKFTTKKVVDAIEATHRLEFFFKSENMTKETKPLINYLKLSSKEVLLRYPTIENVRMWKQTFPEVKHNIISYSNWNIFLKFRALLVAYLPPYIGVALLKLKRHKHIK